MEIEKRHKDLDYGGGQDLNLNVVIRRGGEASRTLIAFIPQFIHKHRVAATRLPIKKAFLSLTHIFSGKMSLLLKAYYRERFKTLWHLF